MDAENDREAGKRNSDAGVIKGNSGKANGVAGETNVVAGMMNGYAGVVNSNADVVNSNAGVLIGDNSNADVMIGDTGNGGWPPYWKVAFGSEMPEVGLPLVVSPGGFGIYSFNLMGQAKINVVCAHVLKTKIEESGAPFDIFITAEAKAIGLTEELARLYGHDEYVVLRKSRKLYMNDPIELSVKSITTPAPQKFFLGREHYELLQNKRVVAVDDVISTGGTMLAFFEMSRQIGFEIASIAVVLTEETKWTKYESAPVLSIDHIPLPGQLAK